jgi:phage baseplate assembly protein W
MKETQMKRQKEIEQSLMFMKPVTKWEPRVKLVKKSPHFNTANGEEDLTKVQQLD